MKHSFSELPVLSSNLFTGLFYIRVALLRWVLLYSSQNVRDQTESYCHKANLLQVLQICVWSAKKLVVRHANKPEDCLASRSLSSSSSVDIFDELDAACVAKDSASRGNWNCAAPRMNSSHHASLISVVWSMRGNETKAGRFFAHLIDMNNNLAAASQTSSELLAAKLTLGDRLGVVDGEDWLLNAECWLPRSSIISITPGYWRQIISTPGWNFIRNEHGDLIDNLIRCSPAYRRPKNNKHAF